MGAKLSKKYVIAIMSILVVCIGCVFYFFTINKNSIVTHDVQELASISVEKGNSNGYDIPIMLPNEDAKKLFDELSGTSSKKAEYTHGVMEFDPPYKITITYKDGQLDQIYSTLEQTKWFRWKDKNKYIITNNNNAIVKLIEENLSKNLAQ